MAIVLRYGHYRHLSGVTYGNCVLWMMLAVVTEVNGHGSVIILYYAISGSTKAKIQVHNKNKKIVTYEIHFAFHGHRSEKKQRMTMSHI